MINSFNTKRQETVINDLSRFRSVSQTHASERVSDRYTFIPTTKTLEVFADHGWFPVAIHEAGTRIPENKGFQKHAIRLTNQRYNDEMLVGSTVPQILLTNSHSGTAAFELLFALFEKVCSNGLVVAKGEAEKVRVMHKGYTDDKIADAINKILVDAPKTLALTDEFKQTILTEEERRLYAKAAIELRFDGDKYAVEPRDLLQTWRSEEKAPTLWNTFNVVQEKVIRGGVRQRRQDGSRIRSKEVKNITENIKLNKALWTLTEEMAKLKAA
jgi:hypothetical protein